MRTVYAIPVRSPWATVVAAAPTAAPRIALRGAVRLPPDATNPMVPPITAPAAASDCSRTVSTAVTVPN
jgi:hypothetical protein